MADHTMPGSQALQGRARSCPFHPTAVVGLQDQRVKKPPICHNCGVYVRGGMVVELQIEELAADDLGTAKIEE